jgi:4-hydroxybenzoate polyprenyltransferase
MTIPNSIKLLRFPFSFFLMPLFLFALSQAETINPFSAIISFFIIHLLVYPASNGYNSYIDKDEDSIGGLEKPPKPTKNLFYLTILMDALALILGGLFINPYFALCIIIYIAASRAYSSKQIRLKKYPLIGFATVTIFQGGFTFYMSYLGVTGTFYSLSCENWYLLIACSLQIAGAYPLTQIYQHKQDLKDGIVTLSYKLGYRGTFVFTAVMFLFCTIFYFFYFQSKQQLNTFIILQLFFTPIVFYFLYWFKLVYNNPEKANFKQTMLMNWVAGLCMNSCFIFMYLIK